MSAVPTPVTAVCASAPAPRNAGRLDPGLGAAQASGPAGRGASFLGSLAAALGLAVETGAAPPTGLTAIQICDQDLAQAQAGLPGTTEEPSPLAAPTAAPKLRDVGPVRTGRAGAQTASETPDALADGAAACDGKAGPADTPSPIVALPAVCDLARAGNVAAGPIGSAGQEAGSRQPGLAGKDVHSSPPAAPAAAAVVERSLPQREASGLPAPASPDAASAAFPGKAAADPPAGAPMAPDALAALNPGPGSVGPGPTAGVRAAETVSAAAPASPSVYPQVAPALVSLAGGPPGTQRLTLRLDPVELGHVQIRIDRTRNAPPEISITAERPETLALLRRDQHQLHRALDQAGIAAEGRQVTFHSAAPSSDDAGSPTSSAGQPFGSGSDAGASGRGQGQGGLPGRSGQWSAGGAVKDDICVPIGFGWLRAGLDITA